MTQMRTIHIVKKKMTEQRELRHLDYKDDTKHNMQQEN